MIPMPRAQLDYFRRLEESTMDRRVSIMRKVKASDNAGGTQFTSSRVDDVPCRRTPNLAGNVEQQFGGRLFSGLQWLFTFPVGTEITNADDVIDGNERFSVLGVLGPKSHETAVRVMCTEK